MKIAENSRNFTCSSLAKEASKNLIMKQNRSAIHFKAFLHFSPTWEIVLFTAIQDNKTPMKWKVKPCIVATEMRVEITIKADKKGRLAFLILLNISKPVSETIHLAVDALVKNNWFIPLCDVIFSWLYFCFKFKRRDRILNFRFVEVFFLLLLQKGSWVLSSFALVCVELCCCRVMDVSTLICNVTQVGGSYLPVYLAMCVRG